MVRRALALVAVFYVPIAAAQQADVHPDVAESRTATAARPSAEEIVVTARRREERGQDVPITLAAFGAGEIEAAGIASLDRLQRLEPSLHVFGFNARLTSISIRALGGNVGLTSDGLEGGVGVFVDDVYIGRVGATLFGLADLERIEVLRGPQGTLFGRNTTAGAISLVTRAPRFDATETSLEASAGNYGLRELKGTVTGPLGDALAGRLTFAATHRDGFMYNVHDGEALQDLNDALLRGQLSFAPAPDLRVRLIADYGEQKQRCCSSAAVGVVTTLDTGAPVTNGYWARVARLGYTPLPFEPFERNVATDAPVRADMRQRGVSAHVDWSLPAFDVTSITAYRDWDWNPAGDFDDTPYPAATHSQTANRQHQTSQEIRIATHPAARMNYVAGLYHFAESVDGMGLFGYGPAAPAWFLVPSTPAMNAINDVALNGFMAAATSWVTTRSDALFGQAVIRAAERLELTAGLRFTHERRHGGFVQAHIAGQSLAELAPSDAAAAHAIRDRFNAETSYGARTEDDGLTGHLTLSYRASAGALAYFTAARGRKAGGINIGNFPSDIDPAVGPDTAHHYELGAKTTALGGALAVNAALYHTTVDDYQTSLLQTHAAGARLIQYISNIDEARSRGGEIDVTWAPGERFGVSASLAYTDAEYVSFRNGPCPPEISLTPAVCDLSGQPIAGAPKRAASLTLQGREPLAGALALYWRIDHRRQSDVMTAVSNSRYSRVEGYGLTNLRLGVQRADRRWDVSWWVRNLFDENYFQLISARSTGLIAGLTGEPRTMGVTYSGRF